MNQDTIEELTSKEIYFKQQMKLLHERKEWLISVLENVGHVDTRSLMGARSRTDQPTLKFHQSDSISKKQSAGSMLGKEEDRGPWSAHSSKFYERDVTSRLVQSKQRVRLLEMESKMLNDELQAKIKELVAKEPSEELAALDPYNFINTYQRKLGYLHSNQVSSKKPAAPAKFLNETGKPPKVKNVVLDYRSDFDVESSQIPASVIQSEITGKLYEFGYDETPKITPKQNTGKIRSKAPGSFSSDEDILAPNPNIVLSEVVSSIIADSPGNILFGQKLYDHVHNMSNELTIENSPYFTQTPSLTLTSKTELLQHEKRSESLVPFCNVLPVSDVTPKSGKLLKFQPDSSVLRDNAWRIVSPKLICIPGQAGDASSEIITPVLNLDFHIPTQISPSGMKAEVVDLNEAEHTSVAESGDRKLDQNENVINKERYEPTERSSEMKLSFIISEKFAKSVSPNVAPSSVRETVLGHPSTTNVVDSPNKIEQRNSIEDDLDDTSVSSIAAESVSENQQNLEESVKEISEIDIEWTIPGEKSGFLETPTDGGRDVAEEGSRSPENLQAIHTENLTHQIFNHGAFHIEKLIDFSDVKSSDHIDIAEESGSGNESSKKNDSSKLFVPEAMKKTSLPINPGIVLSHEKYVQSKEINLANLEEAEQTSELETSSIASIKTEFINGEPSGFHSVKSGSSSPKEISVAYSSTSEDINEEAIMPSDVSANDNEDQNRKESYAIRDGPSDTEAAHVADYISSINDGSIPVTISNHDVHVTESREEAMFMNVAISTNQQFIEHPADSHVGLLGPSLSDEDDNKALNEEALSSARSDVSEKYLAPSPRQLEKERERKNDERDGAAFYFPEVHRLVDVALPTGDWMEDDDPFAGFRLVPPPADIFLEPRKISLITRQNKVDHLRPHVISLADYIYRIVKKNGIINFDDVPKPHAEDIETSSIGIMDIVAEPDEDLLQMIFDALRDFCQEEFSLAKEIIPASVRTKRGLPEDSKTFVDILWNNFEKNAARMVTFEPTVVPQKLDQDEVDQSIVYDLAFKDFEKMEDEWCDFEKSEQLLKSVTATKIFDDLISETALEIRNVHMHLSQNDLRSFL